MRKRFVRVITIALSCVLSVSCMGLQVQAAGISSILPSGGISAMFSGEDSLEMIKAEYADSKVEEDAFTEDEREQKREKESLDNLVISGARDYINVRSTPEQKGNVVGKFYRNAAGTILSVQDGWYEIRSGNVTGFVKADLCVVGEEALELSKEVGTPMALVEVDRLLVREEPDAEANVLGMLACDDELMVLEETDEWAKVDIEEGFGWVSREFVKLYTEFTCAESKEEEAARLAREREERENARTQAALKTISTVEITNENEMGITVAEFAVQFIGNPYVWGGTSLTKGADCSGFVMKVYEEFGVSLPHSSAAQRKQGYAVDGLENAQPGDLICYSGHVALYIGDGMIVHASNEKDGIKVSKAAYRKILAIRRIF